MKIKFKTTADDSDYLDCITNHLKTKSTQREN